MSASTELALMAKRVARMEDALQQIRAVAEYPYETREANEKLLAHICDKIDALETDNE